MNRMIVALMPFLFGLIGYKATAQDTSKEKVKEKKQVEEIVVRKNGDKDATVTIQFKDDKIIVNGKPIMEFNDNDITINKRKVLTWDADQLTSSLKDMEKNLQGFHFNFDDDDVRTRVFPSFGSKTFLGVVTEKNDKGALVKEITKESAAEKAGLKAGDIITGIDKNKIAGPADLSKIVAEKKVKDEVKVTYLRDNKEKSTKVTLGERKETMAKGYLFDSPEVRAYSTPRVPGAPGAPRIYNWDEGGSSFSFNSKARLGIKIQDTEDGSGVKVLEVEEGSAAEKAGMKKDDIVTQIGGESVKNTDQAREQLGLKNDVSSYPIVVKRNNNEMKFDIKIPKKLKTANL